METDLSRAFAALFRDVPLHGLFANIRARAEELDTGSLKIPCTVVGRITPNCYTVSPHAAIAGYARDELVKLPFLRRMAAAGCWRAWTAYCGPHASSAWPRSTTTVFPPTVFRTVFRQPLWRI